MYMMDHHLGPHQQKKRRFFNKRNIIIAIIVIVVGLLVLLFSKKTNPTTTTATIERGTVVQEVSVTGKVKPAQSVDLAFISGGKVAYVFSANNQGSVKKDQKLVELENGELQANVLQAQATLQSQQAKLDELKKGTRPQELAIAKTELDQAKETLAKNYKDIITVLNDGYIKMSDAVIKQIDELFVNDDTISVKLSFYSSNAQASIDSATQRYAVGGNLGTWRKEIDTLPTISAANTGAMDTVLINAQKYLASCVAFLNTVMDALAGAHGIDATTLASYQSGVNTARVNVNTALSNVIAQQQTISVQKLAVQKLEENLALKRAGYTTEQISAQEALVKQAQANVANYQAQLEKTIIRAPFDGVITKKDVTVGEIVSGSKVVMTINGSGAFEIEANIAESDIAKVKIGDAAQVTVDAYGSSVEWGAHVISLDTSETIIESVPTYKARLAFDVSDSRIISGLTANVEILTARKEGVVYVPIRGLILKNGKQYVEIITDAQRGVSQEKEIKLGIRGSDGRVEVLDGLIEGDLVLIP